MGRWDDRKFFPWGISDYVKDRKKKESYEIHRLTKQFIDLVVDKLIEFDVLTPLPDDPEAFYYTEKFEKYLFMFSFGKAIETIEKKPEFKDIPKDDVVEKITKEDIERELDYFCKPDNLRIVLELYLTPEQRNQLDDDQLKDCADVVATMNFLKKRMESRK